MHYVYALYNKQTDRIYIGETSNPKRRLSEHNEKAGNHYTAKQAGDWVLAYKESCIDRSQALKRERQLKSHQGRKFIRGIINNYTSGFIRE